MSLTRTHLRSSASSHGTANTFDHELNFVTDFSAVGDGVTSNTTALSSFNTAYAALSGRTRLTIPPGSYAFPAGAIWGVSGGDRLVIAAPGVTLNNNQILAQSGFANDDTHHANINTVSAGATTVTLVTGAQTSRFTSGQWVVVACVDLQGGGYPINPGVFEFKKIASIGSGTLTFTEPLTYSYKSTYPEYNDGDAFNIYQGGPATVYGMLPAWNQEIEIQGATFAGLSNASFTKCRVAKFTDCTWTSNAPSPTASLYCRLLRCNTTAGASIEVDKVVQRLEIIDCTLGGIQFQSSSINDLYVSGTTATSWFGDGGARTEIHNLNTPEFRFGVTSYGISSGNQYVDTCNSANSTFNTGYVFNLSNYTEEGGGVISIAGGPVTWALPGGWFYLASGTNPNSFAASYQVTDLSFSGGKTFVTTTLPFPVPGTINGQNAPFKIRPHPGHDVTAINCTGSSLFVNQSLLPPHSALFGWT